MKCSRRAQLIFITSFKCSVCLLKKKLPGIVGYIHNFFDLELSCWPAHTRHVFSIHELFLWLNILSICKRSVAMYSSWNSNYWVAAGWEFIFTQCAWGEDRRERSHPETWGMGTQGHLGGSLTWQQCPILLPLEWGERPRVMSHSSVLEEGEERKIPAQVKPCVSAPGRKKRWVMMHFFTAVQLQPCFGGAAQHLQGAARLGLLRTCSSTCTKTQLECAWNI